MKRTFTIHNHIILLLLILITIIIVYFSFILHGGFGSGDDINLVLYANNSDLGESIKSRFFGKHADRPVSMFLLECRKCAPKRWSKAPKNVKTCLIQ